MSADFVHGPGYDVLPAYQGIAYHHTNAVGESGIRADGAVRTNDGNYGTMAYATLDPRIEGINRRHYDRTVELEINARNVLKVDSPAAFRAFERNNERGSSYEDPAAMAKRLNVDGFLVRQRDGTDWYMAAPHAAGTMKVRPPNRSS